MKLNKFSKSVFSAKSTFILQNCHWRQQKLYCEAIELVCGGSNKGCVLVERKARHRVKSEQWQLKPVLISCLYITSVLSWMKSMETICSSHNSFHSTRTKRLGTPPPVSLLSWSRECLVNENCCCRVIFEIWMSFGI